MRNGDFTTRLTDRDRRRPHGGRLPAGTEMTTEPPRPRALMRGAEPISPTAFDAGGRVRLDYCGGKLILEITTGNIRQGSSSAPSYSFCAIDYSSATTRTCCALETRQRESSRSPSACGGETLRPGPYPRGLGNNERIPTADADQRVRPDADPRGRLRPHIITFLTL